MELRSINYNKIKYKQMIIAGPHKLVQYDKANPGFAHQAASFCILQHPSGYELTERRFEKGTLTHQENKGGLTLDEAVDMLRKKTISHNMQHFSVLPPSDNRTSQ